jgi:hypothetical protein
MQAHATRNRDVTLVPVDAHPQVEVFIKVPCEEGGEALVNVANVYVALDGGAGWASYSYPCACGRLHWGEMSRETAALLVGLGAKTHLDLAEPVAYGEVSVSNT